MTQQEVLDFLEKNYPNQYTSAEITKAIKKSYNSTVVCTKKLYKSGFINKIRLKKHHIAYQAKECKQD